ncbi:MAG: extracellular solute-binding protein [Brachymonas sp.]|nr:extracellular solute-binding protein [Brachymonas sp.]
MNTKQLLAMAAGTLLLAACGNQGADTSKATTSAAQPATSAASVQASSGADEPKVLNFYNWPDYMPEHLLADFEKETGIKVNYQNYESNEMLNAKLVAGNSGYDLVVPGSVFAKTQIEAGLLRKLDKAQIPNYKNLDMAIMSKLDKVDPGNDYIIPWGWGYVTVAINKKAVEKALAGTPMPENAWDLVFNPTYTSKLKSCGIAYLDTPSEILPSALRYIGKPAYSADVADYKAAGEMLAKVRPDVRIFSSTMIDDLSSGKACAAIGWSGDINIARHRAVENQSDIEIEALVPSTGAIIFFDTLAIPKDAKHPGNAQKFIDFFLRPENSASLTNEISYPTANAAAKAHVKPEMASDATTFLSDADMEKMVSPESFTNEAREAMNNVFTEFKKGK